MNIKDERSTNVLLRETLDTQHKGVFHKSSFNSKKAQMALVLAVSLWIGNGVTLWVPTAAATTLDNGVEVTLDSNNNVTGINLAQWQYAKGAYEIPSNWTGASVPVNTGFFSLPDETTTILTATTANFFGTVTGNKAYIIESRTPFTRNGITMSSYGVSGVKAEAYNGLANAKLTYYTPTNIATLVTIGGIEWNTSAPAWSNAKYTFNADTVIDASNLTFNGTAYTALKTDSTSKMTLLSGVTGGENVLPTNITQPSDGKGTLAVNYTNNQNIDFTATASGEVTVSTNKVDYTINNVTLYGVDLAAWNGTTSTVPEGWTAKADGVSVTGDGFVAPSITTGNSVNILTTGTNGFFSNANISDAIKFKENTGVSDAAKGVTLLGNESKGVKANTDGKNLIYERSNFEVSGISLGTITWNKGGTARELTAGDYTFNDSTAIDTSSFEFNTPSYIGAGESMTLIGNATGLTAGDSIAHSQSYTNYDNCIKLNATLTGNITRTTNTLGYTATGTTLDSVDLANWNGTTTSVPAGWGSNLGENSIKAAGFTAPTIAAGESTNILTSETAIFNDNQITGTLKYKADAESSDTVKGVTLTGAESKGVKASGDGKSLVYERSNFNISGISLGEMTWGTGREATTGCDFNNVTDANISLTNLKFADPENIAKDATMTLLSGATNLKAGTDIAHTQDFTKTVNGTTLSATLSGNVTRTAETLGYTATGTTLNKATLGSFAWGAEADSLPEGWTASAATTIDATNFKYTGTATAAVAGGGSTTATILNAPGLTTESPVTGGANIEVAVEDTDDKGIKFEATATGDVEAAANKVLYRVNSVALKKVDLSGWNGMASGVPQDWTGSQVAVSTGNFNVSTNLAAGQSIDILTTAKANFFGTVSGDRKYSSETFGNSEAGVTLSGHHLGGVKVEAYGEKANAKLTYYAETMDTTAIALGEMTWDTGRTAGTGYDFRNVGAVTATDLAFTFTDAQKAALSKDSQMTLLSGATNLAADKDVTDKDKTQKIAYTVSNGAALNGTLTGEVFTAEGQVNYDATAMTLDSVNLANWNGTTDSVPTGWTSNLGANSITAAGFTAPSIDAGSSKEILTTNTTSFFNDNQITGALKYKAEAESSNTTNGVTLTGAESKGVKASDDGKSLVYVRSNYDISKTVFGEMTWGVSRDGSGAGNNYARAAIDAGGLQFANWKPEETAANASTILLSGNDTLPDFTAVSKNYSYSVAPTSGVTVDGVLNGSVSKSGNNIVYTATEHKASKLTFGAVNWLSDGALLDHATTLSNMSFANADVDTTNIRFQNLQTAASEDKMTLVSSFGLSIGTVTGTEFSVGKGKGEGHAYLESNDLKYVVTKGVDFNPTGDDNAINEAGDPVVGEIARDVIGGVAQNKGVAENNTMIVSPDSNVTGSVTAAISEKGASENNEAKVTDAHVSGSVTGAEVNGSGTAAGNKATVENTNVGDVQNHTGDVIGAKTDSGLATGNIADVTGGTVEGNVIGAQSTSGTVSTGNKANISGANVGGDVYGGVSTDGEANANQAELSNGAVVNGDVYGGKSENKTATANNVTIENATVGGDVYGGKSQAVSQNNKVDFNGGTVKNLIGGGCETATGNTVTVESGTVKESVYGGKTEVDALENHVILSGGTVTEAVYGGWSDSISGKTQGNSVLLYGVADVHTANIFGGNREATGNTLTIGLSSGNTNTPWTGGEQTVRNINNFETISFAVVPWSESKAAVAITDGTASDLSMSKVDAKKVHFTNVDLLKQRDSMTLLDQSKAAKKATTVEEKSEFTIGTGVQGKGYLSIDKESGNVLYTVGEMGASDQSHNTVMGAEAGMAALSAGNDFVGAATEGLALAENTGSDGLATYANMGGGSIRQETGSHVNAHTWNAILALGHKNQKKLSATEYGAFFEYGTGNYSTFNGDERGDGSTRYTGGGILGKWQKNNGFYVEGSLRVGSIHDDATNLLRDMDRNPYSYNTDATYWGAHVGIGKEIQLNETAVLDLYSKYFYNRRGSVSFEAGGHYDLDAVESSVLRIGTRYTLKKNDNFKFYGGLAVEHEFCGRAAGLADGVAIRGADIGGTSVRGEIGATFRPGEKSNVTLDLNLSGFAGKKRGLFGGVAVAWHF